MTNPLQLQCDKLRNEQSESDVNFWVTTWIFFWEGPLSKPTFCAGAENNKQSNTRERPESTQRSAQWSEQIRVVPFPNEYPILKQLELGRFFASSSILQPRGFSEFYPPKWSFKVQLLSSSMGFVSVASTATSLTWLLSSCSSTAAREDAGAVPARWRPFRVFSWRSISATQPSHQRHHQPSLNPAVLDLQEGCSLHKPVKHQQVKSKQHQFEERCRKTGGDFHSHQSIWAEWNPPYLGGAALEILKHHFWPIKIYR